MYEVFQNHGFGLQFYGAQSQKFNMEPASSWQLKTAQINYRRIDKNTIQNHDLVLAISNGWWKIPEFPRARFSIYTTVPWILCMGLKVENETRIMRPVEDW